MEDRFEKFTLLICKIYRNISKIKTVEMAELGLKSTHVSCLFYLYKNKLKNSDGLTATELCLECDEDKAAISRSVEDLEKVGYLTWVSKSEKKYKTPIVLTLKGEKTGKYIFDRINEILPKVSADISNEDREILYKSLNKISKNLQNMID